MQTKIFLSSAAVILTSVLAAGCGGGPTNTEIAPSVDDEAVVESVAQLKTLLGEIGAGGSGGSAVAGVRGSIEALSIDEGKKQKLLKDCTELEGADDAAKVKSIAERMAARL